MFSIRTSQVVQAGPMSRSAVPKDKVLSCCIEQLIRKSGPNAGLMLPGLLSIYIKLVRTDSHPCRLRVCSMNHGSSAVQNVGAELIIARRCSIAASYAGSGRCSAPVSPEDLLGCGGRSPVGVHQRSNLLATTSLCPNDDVSMPLYSHRSSPQWPAMAQLHASHLEALYQGCQTGRCDHTGTPVLQYPPRVDARIICAPAAKLATHHLHFVVAAG